MRTSLSALLICFVAVAFLSGCATQQVDFRQDVPKKIDAKPDHKEWQNFFVFGLVPSAQNRNIDEYCDGEPARVETELTFLNGLVSGITYNLYSPRTLRIYCDTEGQMGPTK
jgi:hypothetical protein